MTDFHEVWRFDGPPALSIQQAEVSHNGRSWTQRRLVAGDGHWGVVILPVWEEQIGLIRIWRPAVGEQRLELPRGFGEDPTPEDDARRELLEETGLEPTMLTRVGFFNVDTGLVPTPIFAFEAQIKVAEPVAARDGEIDDLVWVPRGDVRRMISEGALRDAITLAALACWQAR